jgi:hypothetical protein
VAEQIGNLLDVHTVLQPRDGSLVPQGVHAEAGDLGRLRG